MLIRECDRMSLSFQLACIRTNTYIQTNEFVHTDILTVTYQLQNTLHKYTITGKSYKYNIIRRDQVQLLNSSCGQQG